MSGSAWLARGLWDEAVVGWVLPTAAQRCPGRAALVAGEHRFTFAAVDAGPMDLG